MPWLIVVAAVGSRSEQLWRQEVKSIRAVAGTAKNSLGVDQDARNIQVFEVEEKHNLRQKYWEDRVQTGNLVAVAGQVHSLGHVLLLVLSPYQLLHPQEEGFSHDAGSVLGRQEQQDCTPWGCSPQTGVLCYFWSTLASQVARRDQKWQEKESASVVSMACQGEVVEGYGWRMKALGSRHLWASVVRYRLDLGLPCSPGSARLDSLLSQASLYS